MGLFNFCCDSRNYVIFLTGKDEDKKVFLKKVFNVEYKDLNFCEYDTSIGWYNLIVQVLRKEEDIKEVYERHIKSSDAVVYLSDVDEPVTVKNHSLFVLMNGKSNQESEGRLLISSVENNNYKDCKNKLKQLIKNIKSEKK